MAVEQLRANEKGGLNAKTFPAACCGVSAEIRMLPGAALLGGLCKPRVESPLLAARSSAGERAAFNSAAPWWKVSMNPLFPGNGEALWGYGWAGQPKAAGLRATARQASEGCRALPRPPGRFAGCLMKRGSSWRGRIFRRSIRRSQESGDCPAHCASCGVRTHKKRRPAARVSGCNEGVGPDVLWLVQVWPVWARRS